MERPGARMPGLFLRALDGCGVIRAEGDDFADLLHRLSTNDVIGMMPGDVRETIIVTEKAKILDAILALRRTDHFLLLVSPGKSAPLLEWLDKYTIMEDVRYSDVSADFIQFELNGDGVDSLEDGGPLPVPARWQVADASVGGHSVIVARHGGLCAAGLRALVPPDGRDAFPASLRDAVPVLAPDPVHEADFDAWRIARGLPRVGFELTADANPLECGAAAAVSFTKGCYIGQEVIARLDTYHKVQRGLRMLVSQTPMQNAPAVPCDLKVDGTHAGVLTSVTREQSSGRVFGLGLLRIAHGDPGSVLTAHAESAAVEFVVVS